jgi:hypothetical protein
MHRGAYRFDAIVNWQSKTDVMPREGGASSYKGLTVHDAPSLQLDRPPARAMTVEQNGIALASQQFHC